jgi:polysaccharide export outer membrane protein
MYNPWSYRSMRRIAVLALLLPWAAAPVRAAEPADYRLSPGDVLEVTVTPQRAFDRVLTIQPDGKISYPLVGEVPAAGLTAAQLAARLRAALNRELVDPEVTVPRKERNPLAGPRVSLLGAVQKPGVYEIKEATTVAEALAAAGGPTPLADLRRVTVTRSDRSVLTVDLAAVERTGHLDQETRLQTGDLVVVPEGSASSALVLGEVAKPGAYPIRGEVRLLDAVLLAGGPTPKADLRRATLARTGVPGTQVVDLRPLLAGSGTKDPAQNPVLQPGDTIVLGESEERVFVVGRVTRPDLYTVRPGDRVLDALAKAGGQASDGDLSRMMLVRRGANGEPVAKTLDLKKKTQAGDLAQNDLILPGDIVLVPNKTMKRSTIDWVTPIASLLTVFALY